MCNCIEERNKVLKPEGLQLRVAFNPADNLKPFIPIQLDRLDEKNKAIRPGVVLPVYCPFCGQKQEVEKWQLNNI